MIGAAFIAGALAGGALVAAWPLRGGHATTAGVGAAAVGGVAPLPLISLNVPAYASASSYPAAGGNSYSAIPQSWRSSGPMPVWLAYDLSAVPPAQRQSNLVVWYNTSYEYDHTGDPEEPSYNMPQAYSIETNTAPGGGDPPANGWTTVAMVKGNLYHSRQHLINLNGANWLRLNVTKVRGSELNYDAALNMDVYDASAGTLDDFIFYGDSITADAMNHTTADGDATDWLGALVHAQAPTHYPVVEAGGVPYLTTMDGAAHIGTWLGIFPGHFVGLSYGTNDANGCEAPSTVYRSLVTMVQAVLAAGKVPLIPHIPYGTTPNIQACGPAVNAQIDALYRAYPRIIPGPDLWAFFKAHPSLISTDGIHPTDAGDAALRQLWANLVAQRIYAGVMPAATATVAAATSIPFVPVATPGTPVPRRRSPQPLHAARTRQ